MRAGSGRGGESGMALVTVFMVLMLASALMVGFFATIVADQKSNGIDRDQTQAYAAAHAGLEKLTSNMAALFITDYNPSKAAIDAIMAKPPIIPGFTYTAPGGIVGSGYAVTYTADPTPGPNFGNPIPDLAAGTTITSGPYAGFKGLITRYPITITARSTGGAEVRLRRELQTVAVPVFQFGVFSETDLTFYAGQNFNFGGRVQTNGNLFLSEVQGATLTLSDRVTAFKEVVRNNLSNGKDVASVYFDGTVNVMNSTAPTTLALATNQGSVTGMPTSPETPPLFTQTLNPSWTSISTGTYKSLLRNGLTGAKYLSLPLVSQGAVPLDLIRRPTIAVNAASGENLVTPLVFAQRYFALGYPDNGTSIRILLSDTAAEIMNLPTIDTTKPAISLDWSAGVPAWYTVDATHTPMAASPGLQTMTTAAATTAYDSSTINVTAIPPFFAIPATMSVGVNLNVICTGRTATTFLNCSGFTTKVNAGQLLDVTGNVFSGAINTFPATTKTTAAQLAINAGSTGTLVVTSTAAFAPGIFWVTNGGVEDLQVTCTGYTGLQLTGCSGLTPHSAAGAQMSLPATSAITTGALSAAGQSLNSGFIKIEMLNKAVPPAYVDITQFILGLGFAAPNQVLSATAQVAAPDGVLCGDPTPNAIVRLQRLRDNMYPAGTVCGTIAPSLLHSLNVNDYWPNALYDTREGNFRDPTANTNDHVMRLGGIMNYVALDVGNLKKWLEGTAPYNAAPFNTVVGTTVGTQNGSGYVVYFSDRRNNKCVPGPAGPTNSCLAVLGIPGNTGATPVETGEYGFEDVVNSGDPLVGAPNGTLQLGEDVNAPVSVAISGPTPYVPFLDVYGATPRNQPTGSAVPLLAGTPSTTTIAMSAGMTNRTNLFRRALKLIDADNVSTTVTKMPALGLTVASENPVYVQGNYNAVAPAGNTNPAWTDTHVGASILADAVTLLSTSWADVNSFKSPNDKSGRPANVATAYRFAVVAGKGLSFTWPVGLAATGGMNIFGTDGGVGNFLRLLEDWTPLGVSKQINYRGSMVSLYTSRQAVGTFKCCERVYDYSLRNYVFDTDFLLPSLLPPGTPMFRDVNTLTFRQLLRPNQ